MPIDMKQILKDHITEMDRQQAERAELEREVARLREENKKLLDSRHFRCMCTYCDWVEWFFQNESDNYARSLEAKREHEKTCPSHPMRALEKTVKDLTTELNQLSSEHVKAQQENAKLRPVLEEARRLAQCEVDWEDSAISYGDWATKYGGTTTDTVTAIKTRLANSLLAKLPPKADGDGPQPEPAKEAKGVVYGLVKCELSGPVPDVCIHARGGQAYRLVPMEGGEK